MFDFSLGEMAVIGAVALVVLGPEKLPRVARAVGQWVGKAQRYVNDVKSDLNREMELSELRKLQEQVQDSAREIEHSMQGSLDTAQSGLSDSDAVSTASQDYSWQSTTHEDFVKPPPSLDELAEQMKALRQQFELSHVSRPPFKYAPRARASRRSTSVARNTRRYFQA
ncbi:MAG: Sec-independent protein translocase subunit TatB [Burkholderiales bacterium]|jgi:sec-independent protein translocase protein TatB|nr:Sec-independent protein translocase subunit TatB [Burkholderiales bacterium]MCA3156804.1 Sec-independent protein translocase subunit TatB [Burkholderiales bacterium]MCA3168347.1 Sec-independent protein translocase subunit TatB [Burkholderiales bacterium]